MNNKELPINPRNESEKTLMLAIWLESCTHGLIMSSKEMIIFTCNQCGKDQIIDADGNVINCEHYGTIGIDTK